MPELNVGSNLKNGSQNNYDMDIGVDMGDGVVPQTPSEGMGISPPASSVGDNVMMADGTHLASTPPTCLSSPLHPPPPFIPSPHLPAGPSSAAMQSTASGLSGPEFGQF